MTNKKRQSSFPPDAVIAGLIIALAVLLAIDRLGLLRSIPFDPRKLRWSLHILGVAAAVEFVAFGVGAIMGKRRQYGIRHLLLLIFATALPMYMYAYQRDFTRQLQQSLREIRSVEQRLTQQGYRHVRDGGGRYFQLNQHDQESMLMTSDIAGREEPTAIHCLFYEIGRTPSTRWLKDRKTARTDISDHDLKSLIHFYHLKYLNLQQTAITDDGLRHLAGLPQLTTLTLAQNNLTDAGMQHLSSLSSLRHLDLAELPIGDKGLSHLSSLQGLQYLCLLDANATDKGFRELGKLKDLRSLIFSGKATGHGLRELRDFTRLEHLTFNSYGDDERACEDVEVIGHSTLKTLHFDFHRKLNSVVVSDLPALEYFQVGLSNDDRFSEVVRLNHLPALKSVMFNGGVGEFEISDAPNIEELTIYNPDRGGDAFPRIGQIPGLRSLTLYGVEESDADGLLQIGSLPELEYLHVSGDGVTDESLRMLKGFPKLKVLRLQRADNDPTNEFSNAGLQHLSYLPLLETLAIGSVKDSGEPLAALNQLTRLQALQIDHGEIGELRLVGLSQLNHVKVKASCRSLSLVNLPELEEILFDSERLQRLSVSDLAKLRILSVIDDRPFHIQQTHRQEMPSIAELRSPSSQPNSNVTNDFFLNRAAIRSLRNLDLRTLGVHVETLQRRAHSPELNYYRANGEWLLDGVRRMRKAQAIAERLKVGWTKTEPVSKQVSPAP